MGDPKRHRKKYMTPMHPWQKTRIDEEISIVRDFGLKNKKEIWKQTTVLKKFIDNYKKTITTDQGTKEKEALIARMVRLGIIKQGASADEILGLHVSKLLERRLQSIVVHKSLARSMKQARQFIVHRHIAIGGKVITSPSYLVSIDEQSKVEFIGNSPLMDDMHPERQTKEKKEIEQIKKSTEKIDPDLKEAPAQEEILDKAEPVEIKEED